MMRRLLKRLIPLLAIALVISCGGNSTGPDNSESGSGGDNTGSDSDNSEPTTGTVEITTSTSGDNKDSDGYTITLGDNEQDISSNGTATFEEQEEGSVEGELSGIAENCNVDGENPRSIDVTAGETTNTTFEVTCQIKSEGKIIFVRDVNEDGSELTQDIMIMNADGSEVQNLTESSRYEHTAEISDDGKKISYLSSSMDTDLYTMNLDGSAEERIKEVAPSFDYPSYSPDRSRVAFTKYDKIWVMDADGSNQEQLTFATDSYTDPENYRSPDWSPDSEKIVYTLGSGSGYNDYELYIIEPDGDNKEQLTEGEISKLNPEWSPDGTKIVYQRDFGDGIYVMDADGSGNQQITENGSNPSWSPNGYEIVYTHDDNIYKINADGSGSPEQLTNFGYDGDPHWGPSSE